MGNRASALLRKRSEAVVASASGAVYKVRRVDSLALLDAGWAEVLGRTDMWTELQALQAEMAGKDATKAAEAAAVDILLKRSKERKAFFDRQDSFFAAGVVGYGQMVDGAEYVPGPLDMSDPDTAALVEWLDAVRFVPESDTEHPEHSPPVLHLTRIPQEDRLFVAGLVDKLSGDADSVRPFRSGQAVPSGIAPDGEALREAAK